MLNREVGFAFKNGHRQSGLSGPKSANKRHRRMQGVQKKAARRRPLNSNLMIVDQTAVNAGL
jgi:hypothetical protein